MGGNALKHVGVIRVTTEILEHIVNELRTIFKNILALHNVYNTKNKFTHGDIDILVEQLTTENTITALKRIYNPKHIVRNGKIISFAYKYDNNLYQVDFITSNNICKDQFYLSYGIIGAIIGKMTIRNNLLYDGGLILKVSSKILNSISDETLFHDENVNRGLIRLTNDPIDTCNFLDLDYERWCQGFDNDNDLFEWIITCNLFKKSCYKIINNKKQQMIDWKQFCSKYEDKEPYDILNHVLSHYDIMDKLLKIVANEKMKINTKSKFSAHMIMDKGINGIKIGKCLKYIKNIYGGKDEFDAWICNNTKETVSKVCNEHIDAFIIQDTKPK